MRNAKLAVTSGHENEVIAGTGDKAVLTFKLVDSLRRQGKPFKQAVSELVDNSADAAANCVHVIIEAGDDKNVCKLIIVDNGSGMCGSTLLNSFTPGIDRKPMPGDSGKYRMGGTIFPLGWFNKKETMSKLEDEEILKRFSDMHLLEERKLDWESWTEELSESEYDAWSGFASLVEDVGDDFKSGTVVTLTAPFQSIKYSSAVNSVKKMVARRYRGRMSRNTLRVFVNGEEVRGACPMLTDSPLSKDVTYFTKAFDGGLDEGGWEILVADLWGISKQMANDAGLMLQDDAGFYSEREGLLVNDIPFFWGECGLPEIESSGKKQRDNRFRCMVKFSANLDDDFGMSSGKDVINVSQSIGDKISSFALPHCERLRKEKNPSLIKQTKQGTAKKVLTSSRKAYVRPKQGQGTDKGRKVNRGNNVKSMAPLTKKDWIEDVKIDHFDSTDSTFYVKGRVLYINEASPFVVDQISSGKASSLDVLGWVACALEAAKMNTTQTKAYPEDIPDGVSVDDYKSIRKETVDAVVKYFQQALKNM